MRTSRTKPSPRPRPLGSPRLAQRDASGPEGSRTPDRLSREISGLLSCHLFPQHSPATRDPMAHVRMAGAAITALRGVRRAIRMVSNRRLGCSIPDAAGSPGPAGSSGSVPGRTNLRQERAAQAANRNECTLHARPPAVGERRTFANWAINCADRGQGLVCGEARSPYRASPRSNA